MPQSKAAPTPGLDPRLLFAIGVNVVCGAIHLAVSPFHFRAGLVYGLLIATVGVLQILWGIAAWRDHSRYLLASIIALDLAVAAAWLASRTIGLPGPVNSWPIEGIDVVATLDELFVAGVAVVLLRGSQPTPGSRLTVLEGLGGILLIVSLAAFLRGFGFGRYG